MSKLQPPTLLVGFGEQRFAASVVAKASRRAVWARTPRNAKILRAPFAREVFLRLNSRQRSILGICRKLGRNDFIHKRSVLRFHDGLAWLMQIAMFLALGLLVFPSHLLPIVGLGLLASLFLMLIARPVSVLVTLAFSDMRLNEKLMISWVGLRGAVPIVLATFPLLAGMPKAEMIFDLVFFIVLTSILLQGTSIPLFAKWLKLEGPVRDKVHPLELERIAGITTELVDVEVPNGSSVIGRQIVGAGFPKGALIVLIGRGSEFIVPNGGTVYRAGRSPAYAGQ